MDEQISTDDLSSTLRKTFEIYGEHLRTFVLVSAIVAVPAALVRMAFAREYLEVHARHPLVALAMGLLPALPLALAFFMQSAAVDVAVAQATLGSKPTVESAYVGALRKLGPIFVVSLLYGLVILGGCILFVIPGVLFMFRYAYALPIVIVEGLAPGAAMTRASTLSEGRKARLFAVYFVVCVVTMCAGKIGVVLFGDIQVPFVAPILRALPGMLTAALCPIAVMVEYLAARAAEPQLPSAV